MTAWVDTIGTPPSIGSISVTVPPVPELAVRVDTIDSNLCYVGEAVAGSSESGAVWRIQKIITSGAVVSVLWATGSDAFTSVWADRLSLTYV